MESKVDWLKACVDSHLLHNNLELRCQTFCLTFPPLSYSPCRRRRRCHWASARRAPSSAWHCHHLRDKKQSVSLFMTTMKSQERQGGANISANKRKSHPSVNSHFHPTQKWLLFCRFPSTSHGWLRRNEGGPGRNPPEPAMQKKPFFLFWSRACEKGWGRYARCTRLCKRDAWFAAKLTTALVEVGFTGDCGRFRLELAEFRKISEGDS